MAAIVEDVAMFLINTSIDEAERTGDVNYYMDFVKLHGLLYLCQCKMIEEYGIIMFTGDITWQKHGPYINNLTFVPKQKGFGIITERFLDTEYVRPSYRRIQIIKRVIREYGRLNTKEVHEICNQQKEGT